MSKKILVEQTNHFDAIDGLRAYSSLGIVLMHVLANGNYELEGIIFDSLIPSFTNLVFLFMAISGFSMCCGCYNKVICNEISMVDFYSKRYRKILPYFAMLCVLDFIISPSTNSIYEIFANLTLCFGLLPKYDITVIGVGWFLGLVFVFYLAFPFYCYLLSSKKQAWISFIIALIFNYLCIFRFDAGRTNIVYSSVYFILGGLIYLYRENLTMLVNKFRYIVFVVIIFGLLLYYLVSDTTIVMLFVFAGMLIYALNTNNQKSFLLKNNIVKKVSSISLEVYLSHMVVYRILEKLHLLYLFGTNLFSYFFVAIMTFGGTIIFSVIARYMLKLCFNILKKENK